MTRAVPCLLLGASLACSASPSREHLCWGFQARRSQMELRAGANGMRIDATLEPRGQSLHIVGTATSREGAGEPLDYPVDTVVVAGDSLRLVFAPLGITVAGRCFDDGTVRVRFSHPQPPFEPIQGTGVIRPL